jgi:hypothetical protein
MEAEGDRKYLPKAVNGRYFDPIYYGWNQVPKPSQVSKTFDHHCFVEAIDNKEQFHKLVETILFAEDV